MATYQRPATRRTYETIQDDIRKAVSALARSTTHGDSAEFWKEQDEACERLRDLWNEIVWQAVDDTKLPHWTRFAAMTTRDDFARRAREARRMLGGN